MIGAGIDPVTVACYLGHSSAKLTLDAYSSPTLGHAAAVATVANLLQPEGPRGSQSDPLASMTTEELQFLRASIDERLGQRDGIDVTPAE